MAGPNLDITFPTLGLSEFTSYTDQPPGTSPSVKNWVLRDPSTGRARGAQRSGTTRYVTSQLNSSNAIQCVTSLNRQNSRIAYAEVNSGNGPNNGAKVWEADVPDERTGDVRAMDVDRFGNVYVLCGLNGVIAKYGSDGGLIWKHVVPLTSTSTSVYQTLYCIQVDYDGDVYVGVGGTSGANNGTVYRFRQVETGLETVWSLEGEFTGLIADIAIEGQWMYVAENTGDDYKLHRYGGIKTRLPARLWTYGATATGTNQPVTAIGILSDGCCVVSYRYDPGTTNKGRVQVISQQGQLLDTYGDGTTEGGCGWGMSIDEDDNIWTTGNQQSGSGGNEDDTLVKLAWSGSALSRTAGYDGSSLSMPGTYQGPDSLATDRDGRCYVGTEDGTGGDLMMFTESSGTITKEWQVGVLEDVYAIVVDPFYPVADTDPTYGASGPEHIFCGTNDIGNSGVYGLHKMRLLDGTITDSTPRTLQVLGVAGGTIKKKASGSSWASTSGGSGALDTNARFVSAAAGFDRVYFTDGEKYVVYNPDSDSGNGAVSTWRADKGRLPPRCKLVSVWNNRLVLARGADDPFNWYMSKVGDFGDWDFFPYPATVDQAVAGNNAPAGRCPDIINTLVPYSDDLLLFGGDHSIWRLTGDPADGGRLDLVSDITGMAFGGSWCKSPEGVLYFMGSRGGVFAYAPGGVPQEVSNAFIRERLAVLDFSGVRPQLAWNDRERAVMVFVCTTDGSASEHYQFDPDAGGWWPITFGSTNYEPLSAAVVDGDAAGDRVVLLGCQDGYVRYWNVSADSDDDGLTNTAIDADLYLGPIVPFGSMDARLTKVYGVLGASSADAGLTIYASDTPDFGDIGTAKATGTLTNNRTATINTRARGQAIWLRLRNNTASERVQFESLRVEAYQAGRVRVRT